MTTKDKYGRPTVMTPEALRKLEEAFAMGCTDVEACLYANIGKSTLYTYQAENEGFLERKEELKDSLKLHAKSNLSRSIKIDEDIDNSKWYLERKSKSEFSTRTEQDITSKGNQIQAFLVDCTNRTTGLPKDDVTDGEEIE